MRLEILLTAILFFGGAFFAGYGLRRVLKLHKEGFVFSVVAGVMVWWALMELILVPMTMKLASFHSFVTVYTIVVGMVSLAGVFCWRDILEDGKEFLKNWRQYVTLGHLVALVLICYQLWFLHHHMYLEWDDTYYVNLANEAVWSDKIYWVYPETGAMADFDKRYVLSLWPIFYAWLSKLIGVIPTIMAHTILPWLIIPLAYMVYGLLADFDCPEETEWWCIIKDTPFDIMSLKSNRRSLITRGLKRVDVKVIIPADYADQMANILIKEWKYYDESYEEGNDRQEQTEEFKKLTCDNLGNSEYLGAFLKDTDTIIGYAIYNLFDDWIEYSVVKTDPEYLNTQVNAALAYFGVERYMRPGIKYIHGGWRTMIHESNYQEYLLKNFGFRKAYCKLHIQYRPLMKLAVNVLYPIRGIIKKFSKNKLIYQVWCTMRQEEIHRTFR